MHTEKTAIQELEQTITKYKRTVYGIALTQLKNKHEADDVFQEVFLLYYLKKPVFDDEKAKRAWLIRTALNKCRQYNLGKWNMNTDKNFEPTEDRTADFESKYDSEIIEAVRELPEYLREPLYLHCFLGLSVNETASLLGIRANTASMRLSRAKKILRSKTEGE
ncbi:RNA polymerase sigma factor [Ruminococcus albus]|uniref:RNA polymerase sigma-70 factor, ECF subfamily n=1 Tax=Ruminococcus albus TaxID=1264 RepID=A0A1H7JMT6_RUMAL|nr:sigma-70 family RNA polymerase sigma factor [Ruminococcus albus]SEK75187.1 RNA polymerase sigma-70 factor, ECF subfamily [Ruminococcus albus]